MFSKQDRGGHIGHAPDGYINRERRTDSSVKLEYGRYERWEIWRLAWDLLLSNRHTLKSICEEFAKIGVLYHQLERSQQKKLLREVIERIVVDAEGTVLRIEL